MSAPIVITYYDALPVHREVVANNNTGRKPYREQPYGLDKTLVELNRFL